jgi:hypothetical protein
MNCNPPADFAVIGGKKLAFDGYDKRFEKLRIIIQSGINKSSSRQLEKSFSIGHVFEKELSLNVTGATLEAKGKKFEGKINSTVFDEKSKFGANHSGTMRIEWNFDEGMDSLFAEGFSITFHSKLDGKDEDAKLEFEVVKR